MLLSFLPSVLLFAVVSFGLGWPIVARMDLAAVEKILASLSVSLLATFCFTWAVYVFSAPAACLWLLPLSAVIGVVVGWREARALWADPNAREVLIWQAILGAWCVAWLATIACYSGGGWTGDWFEHWERARFFLEHGPRDHLFIGYAPLTARPPLANVVESAWLGLTRGDFAHYQLFSTLFASLVFTPVALLAQRFGGERAIPLAALLLMLNPLLVQNATFAWTKLPAAFFALAGLYFFLRTSTAERPAGPALLCSTALAAGILAHYSVGPYAVVLVAGWCVLSWRRRAEKSWWRATFGAAAAGGAVLALWFGWAFVTYGSRSTMLTNTSVTAADSRLSHQLVRIALNIFDTIVPHFLRSLDRALIAQKSPWGAVRDFWFQLYQVNLLFAFGCAAWLVLLVILWRASRTKTPARAAWAGFILAMVVLGIAVHGARDTWGLTHICLQPLVLLGLAFLAARWPTLSSACRAMLVAGATVDFLLGIALHFAVQNFAFERWAGPRAFAEWQANNSEGAVINLAAKLQHQLQFFGEALPLPPTVLVLGILTLLGVALWRVRTTRPA